MYIDFLHRRFFGNTIEAYLWFFVIVLIGLVFKRVISTFISWCLYKTFKKYTLGVSLKNFQDLLTRPVSVFVTLLIIYLAFDRLEFPKEWNLDPAEKPGVRMTAFIIFQITLIISFTWILLRLIDFFGMILMKRAKHTATKVDDQFVPYIKSGLKILVVLMCFFFILGAVFHVNIVALIGGLGIGGLALALASKETVENLLGSFTIFLDKPFTIGDHVKLGTTEGVIENIGLRSTRIRTLEKSLLAIPNKKMVDAELENITLKTMWRARFNLTLTYGTTAEQLKNIIAAIHDYLEQHVLVREDTAVRFNEFADSSLNIQVIYFVLTSDGDKFADIKQEVNFKIMEIVKANGSSFAFPSRSVYVENADVKLPTKS